MVPSIPELLHAEANFHPEHHTIPAWIMGILIRRILLNGLFFMNVVLLVVFTSQIEVGQNPI